MIFWPFGICCWCMLLIYPLEFHCLLCVHMYCYSLEADLPFFIMPPSKRKHIRKFWSIFILILTVSGLKNRIANTIEFSYKIFHAQFPKIAFVHKISVYVHVSPPLRPVIATHKKRSCISQWNKCYKLLFSLYGTCYWYCLWMGMALVTKYVVITCQRRGRWCYISYSFYKRRHFNSKEKQGTSGVKVSGGMCN